MNALLKYYLDFSNTGTISRYVCIIPLGNYIYLKNMCLRYMHNDTQKYQFCLKISQQGNRYLPTHRIIPKQMPFHHQQNRNNVSYSQGLQLELNSHIIITWDNEVKFHRCKFQMSILFHHTICAGYIQLLVQNMQLLHCTRHGSNK